MNYYELMKAAAIAGTGITGKPAMDDYAAIAKIVRAGKAQDFFRIGEQIICKYTATNGTVYDMPFDIVAFGTKTLENGKVVPAMIIQSHYATLESIQFDAAEPNRPAEEDYSGQIASGGWNRWMKSAYRQWLNSANDKGEWWAAQNEYDSPPSEHESVNGFMRGLPVKFLAMLKPVKVETVRNYRDTDTGQAADTYEYDTTYDTFWLPSREEEYVTANEPSHREGEAWQYWIDTLTPEAQMEYEPLPQQTYTEQSHHILMSHRRFALDDTETSVIVRLRSCDRNMSRGGWIIYKEGWVSGYGSSSSLRCTPACAIC